MKYIIYAVLVGFIIFGFVFLKKRKVKKQDKTVFYAADICKPIREKTEEGNEQ